MTIGTGRSSIAATQPSAGGVSRRTVAKGVAWSVPTILVASAAPAHALSWSVWFESLGLACKTPGASCEKPTGITKGYVVRVRVCHDIPYPTDVIIRDATVSLNGEASTYWEVSAVQNSVNCASGVTVGTVPDGPPGPSPVPTGYEVKDDVLLHMDAATAATGGVTCCVIDFGIQGEPSSANVSISGSAPYQWTAYNNATNTFSGPVKATGGSVLSMAASATPPCDKCEIVDVPNP